MSALQGPRNQVYKGEKALNFLDVGLKANAVVYNGAFVVLTGGYGKPGLAALGLVGAGWADLDGLPSVTGGASDGAVMSNGRTQIRVRQGLGQMANSTSTDQITLAHVGRACYLVDDQTVALTDGAGTRSVAGIISDVDSKGVWVTAGLQLNAAADRLRVQQGVGNCEEIAASGALSLTKRTSRLTVSGTKAYTLADGQVAGQRKTLFCVSAAATPVGVVTPAHASGFTTITFGAGTGNSSVELEWDDSLGTPAWKLVGVVTTASGTLTIA